MNIIVMGVTGSGKTTIGQFLADALGSEFHDGDDYHPPANIDKMRRGVPLTDADRAAWLARLHDLMETTTRPVVLACSALKEKYRTQLGADVYVYLKISPETARARLATRKDHFMPASLIHSQFDSLEPPTEAITIDASQPLDVVQEAVIHQLRAGMQPE